MPRFTFQLEAVLQQRLRIEQQSQRAVAELELQRLALENNLRGLQRAIADERADQKQLLAAGQISQARIQAAAAGRLSTAAQRVVLELASIHARLESARAELIEATKRRKAVELLREHRLEAWRHEQNRQEAAATDELAVMRAGRQEELA